MEVYNEIWKTIPSFPFYEASSLGNIRRAIPPLNGHKCKVLRPTIDSKKQYLQVGIFAGIGGKPSTAKVHRLVATAFIGEIPHGKEVNHLDGDKLNNRPDNLEYVTSAENKQHAIRIGLKKAARGEGVGGSILKEADVLQIVALEGAITQRQIARQFGVHYVTVCDILKGRKWRHITGRDNRKSAAIMAAEEAAFGT